MSDAVLDQVRSMVADVFNCRVDQVTPQSSSETIEGWDSLHHLNLVLALEERFGISIDPWQASELTSVEAIVEAVRQLRG
jgi:acyl carrier protein